MLLNVVTVNCTAVQKVNFLYAPWELVWKQFLRQYGNVTQTPMGRYRHYEKLEQTPMACQRGYNNITQTPMAC